MEKEHLARIEKRPDNNNSQSQSQSRKNRVQPSLDEEEENEMMHSSSSTVRPGAVNGDTAAATPSEQQDGQGQHYIAFPAAQHATQREGYGSIAGGANQTTTAESARAATPLWQTLTTPSKWRFSAKKPEVTETSQLLPVEIVSESEALRPTRKVSGGSSDNSCLEDDDDFNETAYLQTKLW